jgi:hypothetical protein
MGTVATNATRYDLAQRSIYVREQKINHLKRVFYLIEDEAGKPAGQIIDDSELVEKSNPILDEILDLIEPDGTRRKVRVVEAGELIPIGPDHFEMRVRVRRIEQ